eukprot:m51a1_g9787 hypothetical protein (453) ;mRNA; f:1725635-1727533
MPLLSSHRLALAALISGALAGTAVYTMSRTSQGPFVDLSNASSGASSARIATPDTCVGVEMGFATAMPFYTSSYTSVFICENGLLTFGVASTAYANECPFSMTSRTSAAVALLWCDLALAGPAAGAGQVFYRHFAACPLQAGECFVVQYNNVAYDLPGYSESSGVFEAVLYAAGDIGLAYRWAGSSLPFTAGLKNAATGDSALLACDNASFIRPGDYFAFRFNLTKDCGDGRCGTGENCVNCRADCSAPCGMCGDGSCVSPETCNSCAADCGKCCGNGVCDYGETCATCSDCVVAGKPCCGDGVCSGGSESTCSCPADCRGACCGDGACDPTENCSTCIRDCEPPCAVQGFLYLPSTDTAPWTPRAAGTRIALGDDESSGAIALPFPMPFFSLSNPLIWRVMFQGILSFMSAVTTVSTQCPYTSSNTPFFFLAPLWVDLDPSMLRNSQTASE